VNQNRVGSRRSTLTTAAVLQSTRFDGWLVFWLTAVAVVASVLFSRWLHGANPVQGQLYWWGGFRVVACVAFVPVQYISGNLKFWYGMNVVATAYPLVAWVVVWPTAAEEDWCWVVERVMDLSSY
jgi:hypothetical protein